MIITARRRAVMSEEKPEPGISNSLSGSRFLEGNASGADWREPAHYNPLLSCDRHCWAGERSEEHTSELQSLMRISYAVFCLKQESKETQTYRCNERLRIQRDSVG